MKLEDLGNRIRIERQNKGLTQEQLAEAADISLNFMSLIENGRNMSIETFNSITKALGVSPNILLGYDNIEYIDISDLSIKQKEAIWFIIDEFKKKTD